jgi:hypothetical protein
MVKKTARIEATWIIKVVLAYRIHNFLSGVFNVPDALK